jgi:hypothetical protein
VSRQNAGLDFLSCADLTRSGKPLASSAVKVKARPVIDRIAQHPAKRIAELLP